MLPVPVPTSNRSTCFYAAEELSYMRRDAGLPQVPLGLITTAIGGTTIEQWSTNATLDQCKNLTRNSDNEQLYDQYILPYENMTVGAFLWYQGENE